jgi:Acetyltransferase (GNAT) domain
VSFLLNSWGDAPFGTEDWRNIWLGTIGRDRRIVSIDLAGYSQQLHLSISGKVAYICPCTLTDHLEIEEMSIDSDVLRILLNNIQEISETHGFSSLIFRQINPAGKLRSLFDLAAKDARHVAIDVHRYHYVDAEKIQHQPPSTTIRKQIRRLERLGFHSKLIMGKACSRELVQKLVSMHRRRWKNQGFETSLSGPNAEQFVLDILHRFPEAQAWILSNSNQEIIGFRLGFRTQLKYYDWLTSYECEFTYYSPGAVLLRRMMESLSLGGCQRLEFMRGEEPYKLMLSSGSQPFLDACCELRN